MPNQPSTHQRGRGWYRGDCHVHSTHSDGDLTPERLTAAARALGLDFLATTEHNSAEAHGTWGEHAGPDLLVILGEEVTTRTGHWLALGLTPGQLVDWEYGARDGVLGRHLEQVHAVGGLCVVAHPHAPYPTGEFEYPYQDFDVVEVWNGLWRSDRPWNADNDTALVEWGAGLAADIRRGHWRPAMGNSDTHLEGQLGIPHTVVHADSLSTPAILAGIRAGRSWIAGSAAVELSFTATGGEHAAGVGERLATSGEVVVVRTEVRGVPSAAVSLHTDRGTVHHDTLPRHGTGVVEWETTAAESAFVRPEVRHPDGTMAALGNPIILLPGGG